VYGPVHQSVHNLHIGIWLVKVLEKVPELPSRSVATAHRTDVVYSSSEVAIVNIRLTLLFVLLSSDLLAQAVVEAAAGAARATTTAVPAQNVGKSINGAFDNLNRTLQNSAKPKPTTSSAATSPASAPVPTAVKPVSVPAAAVPKADVTFEDPSGIRDGMEYGEVTKRFGPPSLKLTTGPDQETLCYTKNDTNVDVTVRSGKVAAVQKTPAASIQ
jgi:hypothetical protein